MNRWIATIACAALVLGGSTDLPAAPPVQEAPLPVLSAVSQSLTDATLLQLLDGLGYAPKKLSKGYLIAIQRESWTYYVQLVLSPDQTKLGMNANLATSADPAALPASVWLALLQDNEDVDPSSFYFNRKRNKLYLHRVLDNHAITSAFLREQIDKFCQNIKSSADDWGAVK
jgi:hypothetical protein